VPEVRGLMPVHHHHMPAGDVVFHDHPDDFYHGLRVVQTNSEGFAVATTQSERILPECREIRWPLRCGYRRHDDS
jgi:hypothetical protein